MSRPLLNPLLLRGEKKPSRNRRREVPEPLNLSTLDCNEHDHQHDLKRLRNARQRDTGGPPAGSWHRIPRHVRDPVTGLCVVCDRGKIPLARMKMWRGTGQLTQEQHGGHNRSDGVRSWPLLDHDRRAKAAARARQKTHDDELSRAKVTLAGKEMVSLDESPLKVMVLSQSELAKLRRLLSGQDQKPGATKSGRNQTKLPTAVVSGVTNDANNMDNHHHHTAHGSYHELSHCKNSTGMSGGAKLSPIRQSQLPEGKLVKDPEIPRRSRPQTHTRGTSPVSGQQTERIIYVPYPMPNGEGRSGPFSQIEKDTGLPRIVFNKAGIPHVENPGDGDNEEKIHHPPTFPKSTVAAEMRYHTSRGQKPHPWDLNPQHPQCTLPNKSFPPGASSSLGPAQGYREAGYDLEDAIQAYEAMKEMRGEDRDEQERNIDRTDPLPKLSDIPRMTDEELIPDDNNARDKKRVPFNDINSDEEEDEDHYNDVPAIMMPMRSSMAQPQHSVKSSHKNQDSKTCSII